MQRLKSIIYPFVNHPMLAIVSILLLTLKLTWNGWDNWDLSLADGALLFKSGQMVAHSGTLPGVSGSPLFALYYGIFHAVFDDPMIIYASHRIMMLLLTWVLLYILLRLMFPQWVAWGVGMYAVAISQNLNNDFVVHAFLVIPILLTYISLIWIQQRGMLWDALAWGVALLVGLSRPEMALAPVLLIGASVIWRAWSGQLRFNRSTALYALSVGIVGGAALMILFGTFTESDRSFVAFSQHFAWGYGERTGWAGSHFGGEQVAIVEAFGEGVQSVGDAFRANPSAFVAHLGWNVRLFIQEFPNITMPTPPITGLYRPVLLLLAVALVWVMVRRTWCNHPNPFTRFSKLWLGAGWFIVPTLLASIVIRPRLIYLLPLQPLLLLLACVILYLAFPVRWERSLNWLMLPLSVWLLVWYPSPYGQDVGRIVIDAVRAIEPIADFPEPYGVVANEAFAYCLYQARPHCVPYGVEDLPAYDTHYPEDWIQAQNVQIILIDADFLNKLDEDLRGYYATLAADPARFGWMKFADAGFIDVYTPTQP